MHLLPCDRPVCQLEPAPRTSLSGPGDPAQWDGFWGVDDERYYARRLQADGVEHWYRVADDAVVGRKKRQARVLPLRRRHTGHVEGSRRMVVLGSSRSGRTILVGQSRRRRPDAVADDTGTR